MNPVKDNYENGECPDCFAEIPDDVGEGDECQNCGHVFYLQSEGVMTWEGEGGKVRV